MVQLLKDAAQKSSNWRNPFMHEIRVTHFDSIMRFHPDIEQQQLGHFQKSLELLYAGHTDEAVTSLLQLQEKMPEYRYFLGAGFKEKEDMLHSALAVSYLRLGEQKNCLLNHNSASCVIPISEEGQHQWKEGSEKAISVYTKILEENPEDYEAMWLMNIAHMTLGQYPDSVPTRNRIPESSFHSDFPLLKFADIAANVGLDIQSLSGGSILEDFNGDNYLDLLISSWGVLDQMQYFQNNGDGTFTERTREAGLTGLVSGLNMVHADYNNDGWPDVLVLRGGWLNKYGKHPNSLLKNLGPDSQGIPQFIDVTEEAGILSFCPTQTATWNDFNQDGWLDLFIGNETNNTLTNQRFPAELFINQRDGTFHETSLQSGVQLTAFIKGVTSGDYDNDGLPDIYISTLLSRNYLFRNVGQNERGIPLFEDVTSIAGLDEEISTFPTWFWDYDNDGWLDIFVSGYNRGGSVSISSAVAREHLGLPFQADLPRLYHNNTDGTFDDVSEEAGLRKILHSMGCNFGDLDNDGFLDMYVGTGDPDFRSIVPNRMFRNAGGKFFQDVTTAGGFGNLQKGHGISFGDLDNDGDQDIYTVMGGANYGDIYQNLLFENPYGRNTNSNHWLTMKLVGTSSNKMALGARITITVSEEGKDRMIVRDITSGASFGASPFRLEVGLGKSKSVKKIDIFWPKTQNHQRFKNVDADQFLKIIEGDSILYPLNLKRLDLASERSETTHRHHQ